MDRQIGALFVSRDNPLKSDSIDQRTGGPGFPGFSVRDETSGCPVLPPKRAFVFFASEEGRDFEDLSPAFS